MNEQEGSRGVRVDSRETKFQGFGYFIEQLYRLRNRWHIAPGSLGLAISGPIKPYGTEAGIGEKRGRPVVAGGMVSQTVEHQYLSDFRTLRMPLAHPNALPEGSGMKNVVGDLAPGHRVTLAEVLKYSSCG